MRPERAAEDLLHMDTADAVPRSDEASLLAALCAGMNGAHVGLGQPSAAVTFTAMIGSVPRMGSATKRSRHEPSALRAHIGEIVPLRSEEQVIWTDAGTIVAMMEHRESVRDVPVMEFPRKAVGIHGDPATIGGAAEDPVTVPAGGGPLPASVAFRDLLPKPFRFMHR